MNDFFIEINNQKFKGFKTVSVTKSLENFVDTFNITISTKEKIVNNQRVPQNLIKVQDTIRILIDNNLILTGFVDQLSISYDANNHETTIAGRSKTSDLVDSNMRQISYNLRDFKQLVETVLSDNGYTDIDVLSDTTIKALEDNTGSSDFGFAEDKNTKVANQTIFEFLDLYAQKVQILLRTDEEGNILLTREETENTIGNLISTKNNSNNNIKSASINIDNTNRFRFNELQSQGDNKSYWKSTTNQTSSSDDTLVRSPRRKIVIAKSSSLTDELNDLAKWEVNLRRAKSINYSCTVQGYYNDKKSTSLWQVNKLVKVLDDKCLLDGQFLIKDITFNKSEGGGSTTTLNIINRGAFTLDPDIIVDELNSNDFASQLVNTDI